MRAFFVQVLQQRQRLREQIAAFRQPFRKGIRHGLRIRFQAGLRCEFLKALHAQPLLRHHPALQLSPEGFVDLMIQFIVFRRFGHAAPLAGTRKGRLFAPLKIKQRHVRVDEPKALVFHRFLPIGCCLHYIMAKGKETAKGSWAKCLFSVS